MKSILLIILVFLSGCAKESIDFDKSGVKTTELVNYLVVSPNPLVVGDLYMFYYDTTDGLARCYVYYDQQSCIALKFDLLGKKP